MHGENDAAKAEGARNMVAVREFVGEESQVGRQDAQVEGRRFS